MRPSLAAVAAGSMTLDPVKHESNMNVRYCIILSETYESEMKAQNTIMVKVMNSNKHNQAANQCYSFYRLPSFYLS